MMKKHTMAAASAIFGATLLFVGTMAPAYAATKVDCDAVMNELNAGKKAKEVAKDLSISSSSVYRCKKHAKEAAKAATKSMAKAMGTNVPSPAAMASPAAKTK